MGIDTYFIWILLACVALYIVRVVRGPSTWDRLLGMSLISTKVILIIVVISSINETAYLLDLAIVYALLGFISIIFTALFLLEKIKGGREFGDNRRRGNNWSWDGFCAFWRNWLGQVQKLLHKDSGDGQN